MVLLSGMRQLQCRTQPLTHLSHLLTTSPVWNQTPDMCGELQPQPLLELVLLHQCTLHPNSIYIHGNQVSCRLWCMACTSSIWQCWQQLGEGTNFLSLRALAEWSGLQSGRSGDSQCIKSLEELISAFKRRETITGNQTTMMDDWRPIFDIELRYLLDYSMMFFTYQVTFPGNITGYQCPEGASACCTPVNKGGHLPMKTHTVMLFENDLLGIIPTPLLVLGTPLNVILAQSFQHIDIGVREYCWSPPTFCNGLFNSGEILRSFSIVVSCYWRV